MVSCNAGAGAHEPLHPWIRNAAASCLTGARHPSAGRVLVWRVFQHNIKLICKLIMYILLYFYSFPKTRHDLVEVDIQNIQTVFTPDCQISIDTIVCIDQARNRWAGLVYLEQSCKRLISEVQSRRRHHQSLLLVEIENYQCFHI